MIVPSSELERGTCKTSLCLAHATLFKIILFKTPVFTAVLGSQQSRVAAAEGCHMPPSAPLHAPQGPPSLRLEGKPLPQPHPALCLGGAQIVPQKLISPITGTFHCKR